VQDPWGLSEPATRVRLPDAVTVAERMEAAVASGPDPDGAPVRMARFLAVCEEHGGVEACVPDALAERLGTILLSQSPYLAQALIREPRALAVLSQDPYLEREKPEAVMRAELRTLCEAAPLPSALRRYRNREYLRLGAREFGFGAADEVGRELAHLAAACLDAAVTRVRAELVARYGEARNPDGTRSRFVVMGMGKLGGEELNFSSDIDLLYLYESDQAIVGDGRELSAHEFFSRLAERVGRAIGDVTDEGYCFRVDLRLRPEGTRGPVTNSLHAAEHYYESWGRPWERQAWLKARPVAGELDLGDEALALLEPFIWPRSSGPEVIRAVHALMARIRAELGSPDDVKLGPGGIREIEFFVQALQLVHGRSTAVRARGSLRALDQLLFAGLTSEREHRALVEAYVFLRRVEHRLQLDEGRQTHTLPEDPARRALFARRLGFADAARFEETLARHRRDVSELYATLGAPEPPPRPPVLALLDPATSREGMARALDELGFVDLETSTDELETLVTRPHSPFAPPEAGPFAAQLLEDAAASPDPDLALRRLVDLVGRRGSAAEVWRLLAVHRPLQRLVVSLFGTSEFLSKELIAHPELLEPLLSAAQAQPQRSRAQLEAITAAALAAAPREDEEAQLNALRRVKSEELLRIGLYDVAGVLEPWQVAHQLSDLADTMLQAALDLVAPITFRKYGTPDAKLAVIGLGKLGGRELGYSSDLDVVFVYDGDPSHFEVMSRLAQRLLHALSAYLSEGRLYEIDTRLRPSGQKGALVSSLSGFRAYHQQAAQLWERQALIKARTVAGDRALGVAIEQITRAHVYGAHAALTVDMAAEIGRLRARMEKELANETAHRFNFKTGRGGLTDVEFLVQYLQLREGPRVPALRVRATTEALAALQDEAVLSAGEARALAESYAFLRRLENRLRIVKDRSIQELTDEPRELDKLARRMGYVAAAPGARLLADYREHADRVRAIYARYLPAPS
jgi:glutamate-ammonia-ligase adenylyltransferase